MFLCPHCGRRLARQQNQFGLFWGCAACHGRAVSVAVLRKALPPAAVNRVWLAARQAQTPAGRPCPTCDHPMAEIPVETNGETLQLDVCKICQFVWFDPGEYESVPSAPPQTDRLDDAQLPQAAREAIAMYKVRQLAEQAAAEDQTPDADWKTVPALFGLPVESETEALRRWPWLTWSLAAILAVISLTAFSNLEAAVNRFGLIPADAWRYGGLTWITSFFLHGGWWHLAGNLYFLLVFGDNVEDYLGRRRWLALVLLATLAGDALHVLATPNSTTPCIGASGGISGLIAFYALKFPRARLGFLIRYTWIQVPAWVAFAAWVALQLFAAHQEIAGFGEVAATAHLGGALAGFGLWWRWRRLELQPAKT